MLELDHREYPMIWTGTPAGTCRSRETSARLMALLAFSVTFAIHGSNTPLPLSNTLPTRSNPWQFWGEELIEYATIAGIPLDLKTIFGSPLLTVFIVFDAASCARPFLISLASDNCL
uniref:Uncharacterized protein n=1 Tax=Ralstonia solanacearum TaxID=305 RepID=A0A0S4UV50_RALSL|nr:protein of unknown function [Ralstonia solanacearum]